MGGQEDVFYSPLARNPSDLLRHTRRVAPQESKVVFKQVQEWGIQLFRPGLFDCDSGLVETIREEIGDGKVFVIVTARGVEANALAGVRQAFVILANRPEQCLRV